MRRVILVLFLFISLEPLIAAEGIYFGARGGHVGLIGVAKAAHGPAVGYGLDFGLRTNPFLDLLLQVNRSSHSDTLKLSSVYVSADLNLVRTKSFDFYLGLGPGVYFFKVIHDISTRFGIHGGFGADFWIQRHLRMGVCTRWQGVFSESAEESYWTTMFRLGYLFTL